MADVRCVVTWRSVVSCEHPPCAPSASHPVPLTAESAMTMTRKAVSRHIVLLWRDLSPQKGVCAHTLSHPFQRNEFFSRCRSNCCPLLPVPGPGSWCSLLPTTGLFRGTILYTVKHHHFVTAMCVSRSLRLAVSADGWSWPATPSKETRRADRAIQETKAEELAFRRHS